MSQLTFAEAEYANKKRKTRREVFLEKLDRLIPWQKLEKALTKGYPKGANGRPPYPLSVMLRIHVLQVVYNLSDPMMEDSLYELESMRIFAGLRLSGPIPDETTILNFRHFLEQKRRGKKLFETINRHLAEHGLMLKEGTIVDATIIAAPSSTKNERKERDPEMHSTKKGEQWHFGMKVHIGVDEKYGLIHSLETTSAEAHDITMADKLLHGEEERVWGDAGYTGVEKRDEHEEREVEWFIAMKPGKRAQLPEDSREEREEKRKASVRAKVEHPFLRIKKQFGYAKVRYRGLMKNTNRFYVLAGMANLLRARPYLQTA
jgi:IS5 family transposase